MALWLASTAVAQPTPAPGFVAAWGTNALGQVDQPLDLEAVIAVDAGFAHVLAVRADHTVAAWGDNHRGQCDVPSDLGEVVAVSAGHQHSVALRADGSVRAWGDNSLGQTSVPSEATNLIAIAAGGYHTLGLRPDGSVVAWGANEYGQATVLSELGPARAIAAGAFHSLVLQTNGEVVAWGYNGNWQTVVPSHTLPFTAIASKFNHNLALQADGRVVGWGEDRARQCRPPEDLAGVVAIAAGHRHSLARLEDGRVITWGDLAGGDLAVPEGLAGVNAIAAGSTFSLALTPGPVFTRQPVGTLIVEGASYTLTAAVAGREPFAFQWERDGLALPNATNLTLEFTSLAWTDHGAYRLRVRNPDGQLLSQAAVLAATPRLLELPTQIDAYAPTNLELRASAGGSPPLAYQWFFKGNPMSGRTSDTLVLSNLLTTASGEYGVAVTNAYGSVTGLVARLTVWERPSFDWVSGPVKAMPGDAPWLQTSVYGPGGGGRFQWQLAGEDFPSPNVKDLTLTNVLPTDAGPYCCTWVTPAGRVSSPAIEVAVERFHPVNFPGRRVVLDAGNGRGLVQGYRWFHDGVELEGQTSATLVIDPIGVTDAGDYTVAARFGAGERLFEVARLTVLPVPAAGHLVSWGAESALPGDPVASVGDALGMATGEGHALALRGDGKVLHWGWTGNTSARRWAELEPIVTVAAGGWGSAVVAADGRIAADTYSWCNPCGPIETNRAVAVAYGAEHAVGLRDDGTVFAWGYNGSGQANVPEGLRDAIAVAAGAEHSAALQRSGRVVVWGSANDGLQEVPAQLTDARAIASGPHHLLALRAGGTVVAWGFNAQGQCNVPTTLRDAVAIGSGRAHSLAVKRDGTVVAWGDNEFGQCNSPSGLSNVVAVAGGNAFSLALVGSTNRPVILEHPRGGVVAIGEAFTFEVRALSPAPLSYQWRHDGAPIPGATGAAFTLDAAQPEDAGDYTVEVRTFAGQAVSEKASLLVNPAPFLPGPAARGGVVVWGRGELEDVAPPATLGEVAAVATSIIRTLSSAIRRDGSVVVWGSNSSQSFAATGAVQVVTIGETVLALMNNGIVEVLRSGGGDPPAWWSQLRGIRQLATAGQWLMALRTDGTLVMAPESDRFPSGLSNVVRIAAGYNHAAVVLDDGTVVMSRGLPTPPDLTNVIDVACGYEHTLALRRDGTVSAWGANAAGQCDVPADLKDAIAIAAGGDHSLALRANGRVVAWGSDDLGLTPPPSGLSNVVAIAAGYGYSFALRAGPVLVQPLDAQIISLGAPAVLGVRVEGAAPLEFQWRFRGQPLPGATNAEYVVEATGEADEGVYGVTITNPDGATYSEAMISLGRPPEMLAQPEDQTPVQGSIVTFAVLAAGAPPLRYQWQFNGADVLNATNDLYRISSASAARVGGYQVIVTNELGAVTSRVAQLTLLELPRIVTQPLSHAVPAGTRVTFNVEAVGTPPLRYQWQREGVDLPGETGPVLVIGSAAPEDAGRYSVRVSNNGGSVLSANALLTLIPAEPHLTAVPSNRVAFFGDDVMWQVAATGAEPLSYQWYWNDNALDGATLETLLLRNVDLSHEGRYHVSVRNAFGQTSSPPAQLTLRVKPNVVAWGTNDFGQLNVPLDLTNAVALSADRHVLARRADGTVTAWGANEYGQATVPAGLSNVIAVATGWHHSLALRADGGIVAWGTNAAGLVTIPAEATNVVDIAAGSGHNLALRGDGTVVGWGYNGSGQARPPDGLTNVVSLAASDTRSLALKADGSVVSWGEVQAMPDGLSNIVAIMGSAGFLARRADGHLLYWGTSRIIGQNPEGPLGSPSADSHYAPYHQPPNITIIATHEIAVTTNGTVTIWGANRNGLLTPPAGLSNVVAVAAGEHLNLAVLGGPTIVRQPQPQTLVAGADATLTVEAVGQGPLGYQWLRNGANLPHATNAWLELVAPQPTDTGLYQVVVATPTSAVRSIAVRVEVVPLAPFILEQPSSLAAAAGGSAVFEVAVVGVGPLAYQWRHNGIVLPGANQATVTLPSITPEDTGAYSVLVSNTHGQAASTDAVLTLRTDDVVVDNLEATVLGPWRSDTHRTQVGTDFLAIGQGMGLNSVTFTTALPRTGNYRLSTHALDLPFAFFTPPQHFVIYAGGVAPVMHGIGEGSGWLALGVFPFKAELGGAVVITDQFANGTAEAVADAIRFRYEPAPPIIVRQPIGKTVGEGAATFFAVEAIGALPLRYQWAFEREAIWGATDAVLTLSNVSPAQAGRYRVLVTNPDGAVTSDEVRLELAGPRLEWTLTEGQLVLSWPAGYGLQSATNVVGPYLDIVPAANPYVIIPGPDVQRFYRVRQ
ncbi:MAG TPA: immunoglobulin domain-containing protein [Verrucomicrobiota bacterium]|nr:immunoglobulin domain-containing protein [Verrucomicrobiota bacterium]